MQITPAIFRAHALRYYNARCTMNWFTRYGLDWRTFFRDGYPLDTMLAACGGRSDPDMARLLDWMQAEGLYEE